MQLDNISHSRQVYPICSSSNLEVIHWSEPTVEENLVIDEQLAKCATKTGRRVLRLWWGSNPTIVLGCGDKPEEVLNLDECRQRGVGWIKRITGGGTVLQTSGVLNYSYTAPDYGRMDMERTFRQGAELLINVLAQFGIIARQRGISDVAVDDLKISGNAQARKWHAVLLHGTLMTNIDRELMEALLRHPHKEPDYRCGRSHSNFITTLADLGVVLDAAQLEAAFAVADKIFTIQD